MNQDNKSTISYDRLKQILVDYVSNDFEAASEACYVYEILRDTCGLSDEEFEELGFGYIRDCMDDNDDSDEYDEREDKSEHEHTPAESLFADYHPVCPLGMDDCVYDPAYIKHYHPEWYESLYGNITPEEAVKESCAKRMDRDDCYDDEDK